MKTIQQLLLPEGGNSLRRAVFWNALADILNTLHPPFLLIFVNRACGAETGGVFSLAVALGYVLDAVGLFGMRNFQATDLEERYTFPQYLGSRLLTVAAMLVAAVAFAASRGYDRAKTTAVMAYLLLEITWVLEDVFQGYFQQKGRLDAAAEAGVLRSLAAVIVFAGTIFATRSLVTACLAATGISVVGFFVTTWPVAAYFGRRRPDFSSGPLLSLLLQCLPLFLSAFLYTYVCNAPKFAIDESLGATAQNLFTVLVMPAAAVSLLSGFLLRPRLVAMAECHRRRDRKALWRLIGRQLLWIFAFTALSVGAAYLLGLPVLELLYGLDLSAYRGLLVLLTASGGAVALTACFAAILTLLRRQVWLLAGYGAVAVAAFFLSPVMTAQNGLMGAVTAYVLLMVLLALLLFLQVIKGVRK